MMLEEHKREFGDLTIRIDRLLCVGFGDCIEQAPEVFEFDEDGIVRFKDDATVIERDRLILSCDICPVDALEVYNADGTRLVP